MKPQLSRLYYLVSLCALTFTPCGDDIRLITQTGSNEVSLSSQGCTKGPHNKEKPPEPVKPEVKSSGEKKDIDDQKPKFNEYIISAPKPQEAIQRPRYMCGDAVVVFYYSLTILSWVLSEYF